MAYFIFSKNNNSIYRIAENQSDLNNLNIIKSDYNIVEDSQSNFNSVKLNINQVIGINNNTVSYQPQVFNFKNKDDLDSYIKSVKLLINMFLNNNKNHSLYNLWNSYYEQLTNLDLNSISYPLNKSIEQYLDEQGQTSLHTLQIP